MLYVNYISIKLEENNIYIRETRPRHVWYVLQPLVEEGMMGRWVGGFTGGVGYNGGRRGSWTMDGPQFIVRC